jgi:hypothetical protein
MRRSLAVGGCLMAAVLVRVAFGEDFKSGLQVGADATPFNVRNITGQNCAVDYAKDDRGSLCYR